MKKLLFHTAVCFLAASSLFFISGCRNPADDYIIGADISFVPQMEAFSGNRYEDVDGSRKDICRILADHHFNYIRLRLFADPADPSGYSPETGFCDLDHTIAMAKRVKSSGMGIVLDFHYSDTWADPDKQYKPAAWNKACCSVLEDSVYSYTLEVLQHMKENGVAPDIIQIGNEINHGILWPDGRIKGFGDVKGMEAAMRFYKSGVKAVREILPGTRIMVHLALGGENKLCRDFLDGMIREKADFDIIGLSYYERWHETYNDLKYNLYDLASVYGKPVCVAEYGADSSNIRKINDIVRSVPNGLGLGTMAWEPSGLFFPPENVPVDSLHEDMRPVEGMHPPVVPRRASAKIMGIYDDIYRRYSSGTDLCVAPPFIRKAVFDAPVIGADISWVPMQEDRGTVFSVQGKREDILHILKENGFNWIRLRLFVDPLAKGGYAHAMGSDGTAYCGIEQTVAMARRVKDAGMKFLLDLHYSDTWADPSHQTVPVSWEKYYGSGLEGKIYEYSRDVVKKFIKAGVRPDMVQTGNEINKGFLWPAGKISGTVSSSFATLLRCASAGVRAADPEIKIMVHIACGGQNAESVKFLDGILNNDVKFDVIGESYYPQWHGKLDSLEFNLGNIAERYGKPVIVVEYKDFKKKVNEITGRLPDGLGAGTFLWEATSPEWGGLFDAGGHAMPALFLYRKMSEVYDVK
ncbi:MAG: arabinogalactan endo-1,4-beta-galactosidase [Bacteroidales bacterium]|jgi:arabinogalactan endo-1,4-beta-galactosidase|nr:arabinogalactan endo-1,4-beta-galactosidase [Bacteroidales bacterium]